MAKSNKAKGGALTFKTNPGKEPRAIRYGSTITLQHVATQKFLKAHSRPYLHPNTSGQDQVTCSSQKSSSNSWIIKSAHRYPDNYLYGEPIRHGDLVRLESRAFITNLHSHGSPSPLSNQQEVTCFGKHGNGDNNDNWWVEVPNEEAWTTANQIRLIHTTTDHALHSHVNASHAEFTSGEQEVTCFKKRNADDFWQVETIVPPILPSLVAQGVDGNKWVSALNLVASFASISGITFLFVGSSIKNTTFAEILAVLFASLVFFGCITGGVTAVWEVAKAIKLRLRNTIFFYSFLMLSGAVVLFGSFWLWKTAATISKTHFLTLVHEVFPTK
jgi:hypothetical protein